MNTNYEQCYEEEYADNFTLTKEEMAGYDILATYEKVIEKLRELKIARNKEQAYNEFNIQLNKLYSIMSKEENAYINDCLLCGKSEASLRTKFDLGREAFNTIKNSAIIRFGIVFNIIVYK